MGHDPRVSEAEAAPTVEQTAEPPTPVPDRLPLLSPGTHLGRYIIERALGAGGMGVVYEARDPALDRKIAIKLLQTGASSHRLKREAQALAKLDHPNVVAVYDVGELDGEAFVAMAFVDGMTLRAWRSRKRSLREVLRVILEAGRGLAAAHEAGLIHRDLKPDNIFVSTRGQALVGDFGLARSIDDLDGDSVRPTADTGTMVGMIVGTPAYIAPEQAAGEPTKASDQFALCVTAWEALYGSRPFHGETPEQLLEATSKERIAEPRHDPGVPKRVRRALERGLRANPDARWPSVDALLVELGGERERRRRLIAVGMLGTAVILGSAIAIATLARRPGERCRLAESRVAEVWSPAKAAEIRQAVMRMAPYAATSVDHAIAEIDAYARSWSTAWTDTCRAELSDAAFDLRVQCLEQRLQAIAQVTATLRSVDHDSVTHVVDIATALPALDHCADVLSLRKVTPAPRPIEPQLRKLEADAVHATALSRAARYGEAEHLMSAALAEATKLQNPAMQSHAEIELARAAMMQGHFQEARPRLESALNHAIAASDDDAMASAYLMLTKTAVGMQEAKRANELAETTEATLQRLGNPPSLRARKLVIDATLPTLNGDFDEAFKRVPAAIRQLEAQHLFYEASALYRMQSSLYTAKGMFDEAHRSFDHEVEVNGEILGTAHPEYGEALMARAEFLLNNQHYAEAIDDYARGYKTLVDALGPDAVLTVKAGGDISTVDLLYGRADEAIAKLRRQLAVVEKSEGAEGIATVHRSLALALGTAGRYDEADRELDAAVELDRGLPGPYELANDLIRAQIRLRQKRYRESTELLDKTEPGLVKVMGADNPALGDIWLTRARLAYAKRDFASALAFVDKVTHPMLMCEAATLRAVVLYARHDRAGGAAARKAALELIDKVGKTALPDFRAELAALH